MISVLGEDGQEYAFDEASKVCTDEHNNLEVHEGKPGGERLTHLFNRSEWRVAEVTYD